MAFAEVRPGVLRMGTWGINWYLVAGDDGVTIVDCGASKYRSQLEPGLAQLGKTLDDVRAVIVTHGDGDHIGFAGKLQEERPDLPVLVHAADVEQARKAGSRKREASFIPYLRRPATWKILWVFARGGFPVKVPNPTPFEDGALLDVPGRARVIHGPGHSPGCVAFHFADHDALFVGDVLFTYNVLTGRVGPQISPSAFNTSSDQALESLGRLEQVEAAAVLPGHGDPWTGGVAAAVAAARAAGKS
jgi:glyoxylase-like metal-dependent hydrolase (beta-lactamase superfamily II)